ncbi:MAG: hypothetical protein ABS81_06925 [Pseudonocardia sp. SCN 72-86]|nr:MAG: hypothetical protein ABS81_06925 [Pseudonocardia sp. SCN 72-86]
MAKFAELTHEDGLIADVDHQPLCNFVVADRLASDGMTFSRGPMFDAELAVLNARVDNLQGQVERLLDHG